MLEEGVNHQQMLVDGNSIQLQKLDKKAFALHTQAYKTLNDFKETQRAHARSVNQSELFILEEEIAFIENVNSRSYTFQVLIDGSDNISNLVVFQEGDTPFKGYLVTYSQNHTEVDLNTSVDNNILVNTVNLKKGLIDMLSSRTRSNDCFNITGGWSGPNDGGHMWMNEDLCEGKAGGNGEGNCELILIITGGENCNNDTNEEFEEVDYGTGSGTSGTSGVIGSPSGGSGTGSAGTTTDTPTTGVDSSDTPILTTPLLPRFFDNGNPEESLLINSLNSYIQPDLSEDQISILLNNNENIEFGQNLLHNLSLSSGLPEYSATDYPGQDDGLPFQWWNDSDFIDSNFSFDIDDENLSQLTALEKILIVIFPAQAFSIKQNKLPAEQETVARFGFNGRNDESDAFRHSFFNAMNSNDAGDRIARLFSNAHESENPLSLILEKEMDIFNNNVGHLIGDDANIFISDNDLSNLVYMGFTNGDLRYITPLDFIASPNYDANGDGIQDCSTCLNGILPSSVLTPTN